MFQKSVFGQKWSLNATAITLHSLLLYSLSPLVPSFFNSLCLPPFFSHPLSVQLIDYVSSIHLSPSVAQQRVLYWVWSVGVSGGEGWVGEGYGEGGTHDQVDLAWEGVSSCTQFHIHTYFPFHTLGERFWNSTDEYRNMCTQLRI